MVSLYLPGSSKQGVGYQAHGLANSLIGRGHSVTVFSPDTPGPDSHYEWRRVEPGRHVRTFQFARRLRDYDLRPFDVIHAHGDDYWLTSSRTRAHVRTMHGSCFAEALRIRGAKERARMLALGLTEVMSTAVADVTVAVSDATRAWYPWIKNVVPNGVDLSVFTPGDERASVPTILFVGTYGRRKRGKLLVEHFQRVVRPAMPDAQLWMVCDDAPESPGVTVLGRVSGERLRELYQQAWLFCLPSSYEGFGVPYIEAMASGTPVVATRNVGAREVTDNGRYGALVADEALGQCLVNLLNDDSARKQLSADALEWVQQYGWPKIVTAYEGIYQDALTRRQ